MEVKANPFDRLWADTSRDVLGAVQAVGESGWFVLGQHVRRFEQSLSEWFGGAEVVGCANGLDGLEIGLRALGVGPGDRVLTTPLSAFATTLAITRAGATPVYVDVDARGLMDLDRAEERLQRGDVRAMVPVHLFGHALDLDRLERLMRQHDLVVVEDCAQAVGARHGARVVGTVGQAAATSFYPTKNLGTLGDGGAVLSMDEGLAEKFRVLRDYGQTGKYEHAELGLNSRLDEVHAAIMLAAFVPRLLRWTERRKEIAARYDAGLKNALVAPLGTPPGSSSVWHLYPVAVSNGHRDALLANLRGREVQAGIHYPKLIPNQDGLAGTDFELFGTLERGERLVESELSLPINPYLRDDEIDRVIAAVNEFAP